MERSTIWIAVVALFAFVACGGFPTEPSDYEFGRADVYVRDAAGVAIDGANVRLDRMNGQVEDQGGLSGTAGLPGYYFFLKTSGEYRIVVTPPAGYEFAPGQTNPVVIRFSRNQTQTINFVLRRL